MTLACYESRSAQPVVLRDDIRKGRHPTVTTGGNVCFGGPKRNRLFMAASQSLYAVYVNTQGAAPG
jgi:sugar lactone lactonase YvrE